MAAGMIRIQQTLTAIQRWINKQRRGHFAQSTVLSLITRPLWQYDRIRALMGAPLVVAAVIGTNVSMPATTDALQAWDISQPVTVIQGYTPESDHTYLLPVASLTGISQYFHTGHPGVDLRAPLKSDVLSMDNGVVTNIVEQPYGYGRHILITHEDGLVTLYAHLGLIMVEVGDRVTAGQKIAEVGLTGRTTGPHLHFEVRSDRGALNPIPLLSKALTSLKAH